MSEMVLDRFDEVVDFNLRKGQPGTIQRTLKVLERAPLSAGAVQMHKIAVREAMLSKLPTWKRRLFMSRHAGTYLAVITNIAAIGMFVGYLAWAFSVDDFPNQMLWMFGFFAVATWVAWKVGQLESLHQSLTWSESNLEFELNPDIPVTGKVLTRALQQILGKDATFTVHRLGPDPFLEVRYHGESAFYFGWDDAAELVDNNGTIEKVSMDPDNWWPKSRF